MLGAELNILATGLQQLFPATGLLAPVVGELVARGHSRSEEHAADRHAVEILRRAGYSKNTMIEALTWIRRIAGAVAGAVFDRLTPALDDRIEAILRLR